MVQRIAVAMLVAMLLAAIGLAMEPADFRRALVRKRELVLVTLLNLIVLPALALLVVSGLALPEPVAVGILICAASPGGPAGLLFATVAGGDVAFAVTSVMLLSVLSVATAPATLSLLLGVALEASSAHLIAPMVKTLLVVELLPLLLGMLVHRLAPERARRWGAQLRRLASVFLVLVSIGVLVSKAGGLSSVGLVGMTACVFLVVVALLAGFKASNDTHVARSAGLVTGVRNIALALLISGSHFPDPATAATVITFGLFTMLIPWIAARIIARRELAAAR
jgi:BASS family bile acid:Na+ symporter